MTVYSPWRMLAVIIGVTATFLTGLPASADPSLITGMQVVPLVKRTDYRRADFGVGWPDDGHGCDVRDDILARDLTAVTVVKTSHCGQAIAAGTLTDPYTGVVIPFTRGEKTSAAVQIDHIVPLAYAWDMGAWAWTPAQRAQFYRDPTELLAVSGPANDNKGDKPLGEWLPPNTAFACQYVTKFVGVLRAYGLPVDPQSATVASQETC